MIILPNTKKEDASVMAERLRTRIENSPLSVDGSLVVATVSVGVASYPEAGSHCGRTCQSCGCRHVQGETAGEEQGGLCLTLS
jgi:GGDEF domain-containing protein